MSQELIRYLDFFREPHIAEKQQALVKEKLRRTKDTRLGRMLGSEAIEQIPITGYPFYKEAFENPTPDAFVGPLDGYVRVLTSGSMGTPKWYMVPLDWLKNDLSDTTMALLVLSSYDGEKFTLEKGDTFYGNFAPKPFGTGFWWDLFRQRHQHELRTFPENQDLPFPEKVGHLIRMHKDVHVVFLPFSVMMNVIYPQIRNPFKLKGYISLDMSVEYYRDEVKRMNDVTPVTVYASTEAGLLGIPSPQHFMGLIFDWRSTCCEFIPEDKAILKEPARVENAETKTLEEVRVGDRYQLVVTPINNDITRYVMMDLFQCIAKGDDLLQTDLPVFKFLGRVGGLISLHNFTRIDDDEIITGLRQAGISYRDFTARREVQRAMEFLHVYLEPKDSAREKEVADTLHASLVSIDKDYANLSQYYRYTPLSVTLLPQGTFDEYIRAKTGMIKPERIGMKEENFKKLLGIAESFPREN